jgi:voltage-gated sodium channel
MLQFLKDNLNFINKLSALFIIISAISIGIEASLNAKEQFLNVFYILDIFIIAYFSFELVVRIVFNDKPLKQFLPALKNYLSKEKKSNLEEDRALIEEWMWLIFDGLLVIMGFIALFRHLVEHPQLILLLRLFRVFRIFRIFELNQTLKDIEKKIISVVPTIATFLVLIFLILYAYAIVGMYMYDFRKYETIDFSGVYTAMTSLFVMMTNGWSDTLIELRSHHIVPNIYSDIYIISFFIFSVLVTLNVFLAVMTSQIQDKLAKEIADDHNELLEKDKQILSAEHSQQKEIQELNAKLDAILERLNKG